MTAPETAPAERHMGDRIAETIDGLSRVALWIQAHDTNATNWLHCKAAADLLTILAATPTALPSAEDALRARALAFLAERIAGNDHVKLAVSNGDLTVVRSLATEDVIGLMLAFAALQSPRASDEVPGEASGASLHDMQITSASPVPVDASGVLLAWFSDQHRLELTHYSPVYGDDDDQSVEWRVHKQGGSINDREWDLVGSGETALAAIQAAYNALSHTAPVADAQAGEGK